MTTPAPITAPITPTLPRSYLYVPGNAPDKLPKAWSSGADAVIVDLEDAVPLPAKAAARETVRSWLAAAPSGGPEVWVRVNPDAAEDLAVLLDCPGIDGLVLAKATLDSTREVSAVVQGRELDWMLSPLLETPGAVLDVGEIAAVPRVRRLQIGEYDLCAEIGMTPGPDELEVLAIRTQVVLAGADAGIDPPVAPVSVQIRDTGAFAVTTRRAKAQGFVGRACIHPAQLPVVHEAFTPSADDVAAARSMVALFEEAEAEGRGVVVDERGRLVDLATVRTARRTLSLARPSHV